jgi:hypothetical protein
MGVRDLRWNIGAGRFNNGNAALIARLGASLIAELVQAWLAWFASRTTLYFVPRYCPHLTELLRELMHKRTTHTMGNSSSGPSALECRNPCTATCLVTQSILG